jgi:hypothetical protein
LAAFIAAVKSARSWDMLRCCAGDDGTYSPRARDTATDARSR